MEFAILRSSHKENRTSAVSIQLLPPDAMMQKTFNGEVNKEVGSGELWILAFPFHLASFAS